MLLQALTCLRGSEGGGGVHCCQKSPRSPQPPSCINNLFKVAAHIIKLCTSRRPIRNECSIDKATSNTISFTIPTCLETTLAFSFQHRNKL